MSESGYYESVPIHSNQNKSYAITGPNGCGKSSFAQILSGYSTPTSGELTYSINGKSVPVEEIYKHLSFAAPYVELIEEFTLNELLQFHFDLKAPIEEIEVGAIPDLMNLSKSRNKQIRNFSSGMKQRLKLGLAFFTPGHLVILDEPTTNLDESGVEWYLKNVEQIKKKQDSDHLFKSGERISVL